MHVYYLRRSFIDGEEMSVEPASHDRAALDLIVRRLEAAWNAGDGEAFAAPFAEDADFVTIRGEHFSGKPAIGAGHAAILRTVYAGSTNHMAVEAARLLRPDVALVRVYSSLEVPRGLVAGTHRARFTLLLTRDQGNWEIASLHNTLEVARATSRDGV
jgi:uncharacterized protein (TIGR02246 family)